MDYGLGFRNWDHLREYGESPSSIDISPPPSYNSEQYTFDPGGKNLNTNPLSDDYDYDIDEIKSVSKSGSKKKRSTEKQSKKGFDEEKSRPHDIKRMSTEERMKEILERNKLIPDPKPNEDTKSEFGNWESSIKNFMQGLGLTGTLDSNVSSTDTTQLQHNLDRLESKYIDTGQETEKSNSVQRPRSESDSFELSDADMEVGVYAAKRAKEKALLRQSSSSSMTGDVRSAAHAGGSVLTMPAPIMSPDLRKGLSGGRGMGSIGFASQTSNALSSIRAASNDTGDAVTRFGSTNASDADENIFNMISEQGFQDDDFPDTTENLTLTQESETDANYYSDDTVDGADQVSQAVKAVRGLNRSPNRSEQERGRSQDSRDGGEARGTEEDSKEFESAADYSLDDFEQPSVGHALDGTDVKPFGRQDSVPPSAAVPPLPPEPLDPLAAIKMRWLSMSGPLSENISYSQPVIAANDKNGTDTYSERGERGDDGQHQTVAVDKDEDYVRGEVEGRGGSTIELEDCEHITTEKEFQRAEDARNGYTSPPSPPPSPPLELLEQMEVNRGASARTIPILKQDDAVAVDLLPTRIPPRYPSKVGFVRGVRFSGTGPSEYFSTDSLAVPPPPPADDDSEYPKVPYLRRVPSDDANEEQRLYSSMRSSVLTDQQQSVFSNESSHGYYRDSHQYAEDYMKQKPQRYDVRNQRPPAPPPLFAADNLDPTFSVIAGKDNFLSDRTAQSTPVFSNKDKRDSKLVGVVAPTRHDLLAHLAVLSTKQKPDVKASEEGKVIIATIRNHSSGQRIVSHDSDVKWSALNRAEQTSLRLQRQFESLNKQVLDIRSTAVGNREKLSLRSSNTDGKQHSERGKGDGFTATVDNEMMNSLQELLTHSRQLVAKEHELRTREQAVESREDLAKVRLPATNRIALSALVEKRPDKFHVGTNTDSWAVIHSDCRRKERELQDRIMELKANLEDMSHKEGQKPKSDSNGETTDGSMSAEEELPPSKQGLTEGDEALRLRGELNQLEKLVAGYQRENERLVNWKKSKEAEVRTLKASFYEERETLNRELNRLRNLLAREGVPYDDVAGGDFNGGDRKLGGKSAETLRAELALDASRRALEQERLNVKNDIAAYKIENDQLKQKLAHVENELTMIQSKKPSMWLSREWPAELTAEDVYGPRAVEMARAELEDLKMHLRLVQDAHAEEKQQLLSRLQFFSDTQASLSELESERSRLLSESKLLRRELENMGVDVREMFDRAVDNTISTNDTMNMSTASVKSRKTSRGRSFADIKRIKELESALQAAQDAIRQRFPDSLANLVQAARIADEDAAAATAFAKKQAQALREELAETEKKHAISLRVLRQEHERLRLQYEERVARLEERILSDASNISSESADGVDEEASPKARSTPSKEVQRRRSVDFAEKREETAETFYAEKEDIGDQVVLKLQKSNDGLMKIIEMLQDELFRTAEELGKEKALCKKLLQEKSKLEVNAESISRDSARKEADVVSSLSEQLRVSANQNQELLGRISSLTSTLADSQNQANTDRMNLQYLVSSLETQLRVEKSQNEVRINRDLEEKSVLKLEISRYQEEVRSLHEKLRQPQTPQMAQYVAMEAQLRSLEERLKRRDADMQATVEESRAAARLERARLQAIHDQELREKDEQLLGFQKELQTLIAALRKQTLSNTF